ncbi:hypothetical protein GCM10027589_26530 [Actinocorallia lasiicapitis]
MLQQRGVELGEQRFGDVADVEADHLGADPAACLANVEICQRGLLSNGRVPFIRSSEPRDVNNSYGFTRFSEKPTIRRIVGNNQEHGETRDMAG